MLEFPEQLVPKALSINLVSNSKIYQSPFNRSVVTHKFLGARWMMEMNFENLDNINGVREIDILQSFVWSLDGVAGRFLCRPFGRIGAMPLGNPVVSQTGQHGNLLVTKGWTPNNLVLKMGDFISINNELKQISKDISSNAQGYATLQFNPPLRVSPSANTPIKTFKPTGTFRLADNDQGNFSLQAGINSSVSLSIIEAFNV